MKRFGVEHGSVTIGKAFATDREVTRGVRRAPIASFDSGKIKVTRMRSPHASPHAAHEGGR